MIFALLCTTQLMAQRTEMHVYIGDKLVYAQEVTKIDSILIVEVEPTPVYNEEGVLKGVFSVGVNKKVRFTRGNLQYQASTGTWRFAEQQYSYVGGYSNGNVVENEVKSKNEKISSTYDGWIDLFGWGTSGYNQTYPYIWTFNTALYGQPQTNYVDLTNSNYDWGEYCVISNAGDKSGLWHTMNTEEWKYLFHTRGNADFLRGFASIDSNNGYILLPDNWTGCAELDFTPSATNYTTNVYTLEEWQMLEDLGAVFLPAAGFRWEQDISSYNTTGFYWSATANVAASADRVQIAIDNIKVDGYAMRNSGQSVRLVQFVKE